MLREITFDITQEHIDRGEKGSGRSCPIALAITDQGIDDVIVGGVFVDTGQILYDHNLESRIFMRDFDKGHIVFPCSMTLCESH